MSSFPEGRYIIHVANERCLTLDDHRSGAAIAVLPPSGTLGEQEWYIATRPSGSITLKNLRFGKYIGFEREPQYNKIVVAMDTPTEFDPIYMGEPGVHKLEVIGGWEVLCLGISPGPEFPGKIALVGPDQAKPWRFQSLK